MSVHWEIAQLFWNGGVVVRQQPFGVNPLEKLGFQFIVSTLRAVPGYYAEQIGSGLYHLQLSQPRLLTQRQRLDFPTSADTPPSREVCPDHPSLALEIGGRVTFLPLA